MAFHNNSNSGSWHRRNSLLADSCCEVLGRVVVGLAMQMHCMLCGDDCHSHVAHTMNRMSYRGCRCWNKGVLRCPALPQAAAVRAPLTPVPSTAHAVACSRLAPHAVMRVHGSGTRCVGLLLWSPCKPSPPSPARPLPASQPVPPPPF